MQTLVGNSATVARSYLDEQQRYIGDHVTPMAHDLNGAAPALVRDGEYNVVMANEGLARLMTLLGLPGHSMLGQPMNLLRAIFAPGGLRSLCVDEAWLCGEMWARACREASV